MLKGIEHSKQYTRVEFDDGVVEISKGKVTIHDGTITDFAPTFSYDDIEEIYLNLLLHKKHNRDSEKWDELRK